MQMRHRFVRGGPRLTPAGTEGLPQGKEKQARLQTRSIHSCCQETALELRPRGDPLLRPGHSDYLINPLCFSPRGKSLRLFADVSEPTGDVPWGPRGPCPSDVLKRRCLMEGRALRGPWAQDPRGVRVAAALPSLMRTPGSRTPASRVAGWNGSPLSPRHSGGRWADAPPTSLGKWAVTPCSSLRWHHAPCQHPPLPS